MVRLRIAALLRARGLTAYALGRGSGITYPTAYRLARESGDFSRLERDTLNRLCQFLRVQPGELIEWVPDAEHDPATSPPSSKSPVPPRPPGPVLDGPFNQIDRSAV